MIKNVIFDLGGVLFDFRKQNFIERTGCPKEYIPKLHAAFFWNWELIDANAISYEEYIEKAFEMVPNNYHPYLKDMFDRWYSDVPFIDGMLELIEELSKKYDLYILSNIPKMIEGYLVNYPFYKYFKGEVLSGVVEITKPDARIYQHLLNKYNLKANECLFIDDRFENITQALQLGIHGFHFEENPQDILPEINRINSNPYFYSLDNKRYQTFNYYVKTTYKEKLVKIPLDAGFTCPNRDGSLGYGGCDFCPGNGINNYPVVASSDLLEQYQQRQLPIKNKWPNYSPIPYFQSFSNTYGSIERLKEVYKPFLEDQSKILMIATRVDCLNDEVIELLSSFNQKKQVWVELGVQSIHDETLEKLNCHHTLKQALSSIEKLRKHGIKVTIHLINGLPKESKEMMIESARLLGSLDIQAMKFHTLLVLKNSALEKMHRENPIKLLTKDEYLDILVSQLEVIRPDIIIERALSDSPVEELISPSWPIKKTIALNDLDKLMVQRDTYQGKYYEATNHN